MADSSSGRDPFENFIGIVAGPIAAVIRSFDQLRKGADELIKGLENFNRTMANLNETAERVNSLLNEFEEPARTIIPQVVRTVKLAEDLAGKMSGPVEQIVPGLSRLAETLSSPVFTTLPTDLSSFVDSINDLVKRLSPLGQLAESAGGLLGGFRIPGLSRPAEPAPVPAVSAPEPKPTPKAKPRKPAAKKSPAKSIAAKKRATS